MTRTTKIFLAAAFIVLFVVVVIMIFCLLNMNKNKKTCDSPATSNAAAAAQWNDRVNPGIRRENQNVPRHANPEALELQPGEDRDLAAGTGKFGAPVVVMFHSKHCGHCLSMMKEYGDAAKSRPGKFVLVDAARFAPLLDRYEVRGFPHIVKISRGMVTDTFEGKRDAKSLLDFESSGSREAYGSGPEAYSGSREDYGGSREAYGGLGTRIPELRPGQEAELVARKTPTLVIFHGEHCGHCKKMMPDLEAAYSMAMRDIPFVKINAANFQPLLQTYQIQGVPEVVAMINGKVVDTLQGRDVASIVSFAKKNAAAGGKAAAGGNAAAGGPMSQFGRELRSGEESNLLTGTGDFATPTVVLFKNDGCPHCRAIARDYAAAALESTGSKLVAVDAGKSMGLLKHFNVTGVPHIVLVNRGKVVDTFKGERSKDNFLRFAGSGAPRVPTSPDSGAPPAPHPKPLPPMTMDGDAARHFEIPQMKAAKVKLTDHGRELQPAEEADFLAGRGIFSDGVIAMAYGDNCGHCKTAAPEYKKATEENGGIMMVAINAAKFPNIMKKFGIRGIPKIFHVQGGKEVRNFEGKRQKADFLEFAKGSAKKTIPSSPFQ